MNPKNTGGRWHWPNWRLCCFLLLSGCHSIPTAEVLVPARVPELVPVTYAVEAPTQDGKPIPISLDTVLRSAQDNNGQIRLARMRLDDATYDQHWAAKHWLPDLSVGIGTYRHEGAIQDFQGNIVRSSYGSALAGLELTGKYDWKETLFRRVEAERRVWQQKGELSKLTSENLLDASTTYVALVAARTGAIISLETEVKLKDLLDQTIALAQVDPGIRVEVSRIETELMAQTVLSAKLREAGKGSAAKLAYLLGLNPCCDIIIADKYLATISLVDAHTPVDKLVDRALSRGPGVRELEGLLRTVQTARNTNYGATHWMPSVELNIVEGSFGGGPGRQIEWANRFDAAVHMRWNLNEFVYAKQKRHQADANIQQVHLSIHDLRSKLALGVQEAREATHSNREQVKFAERHIRHAEESYKLSDQRLRQNIKGRSSSEVLLALRTLSGARLEYIQAVRDLNKAQLRLFILIGAVDPTSVEPLPIVPVRETPRRLPELIQQRRQPS
ncbi:MAG: TolC family protein [Gemmataceae bacterium]|nr:TolC family protein [Gemmataceae bacterium]